MKNLKTLIIIAVLAFAAMAGWQVGSREVANLELQEDMRDLVSQKSFRFGNSPGRSDDELRDAVIRKASEYNIDLKPEQVTVEHPDSVPSHMSLAADYSVPVNLPKFSFELHFTPSSAKTSF